MRLDAILTGLFRTAIAGATGLMLAFGASAAQAQTTLTVLQAEAPRSMDPGDETASSTDTVLQPMYEGLVERNKDGQVQPSLATSWTTSADGRTWTFKLRPNVKFQDGTPLNAEAVAHTFLRFLDTKRGLAAAGGITPVIANVKPVDDLTVEFDLKGPYAGFLALMSTGVAKIVSEKADEAGTLDNIPVGTGPFKFVEWKSGDYVLEARNDSYWGAPAGVDQIKFIWSAESSVLSMSVQSGQADVVYPLPPVFAPTVKANPNLKLSDTPGAFVYWMSLNTKLKPLDDMRVRQALNYATDKDALVKGLLRGFGTPANSPLPPTNPFYDASLNPYPYDPGKAKQLLAEAGYPNGFTMNTAVQARDADIANALQGMWTKIGVNLVIRNQESGVWAKAAFADPAGKAADNLDSTIASWSTGFDPDLQLRPLYATASAAPAGANLGFFSDPKLDALLDRGAAELDEAKAKPIYDEAQQLINEEAPHVLLYSKHNLMAYSAKVSGVWMQPDGVVMVQDATISQ